MAPRAGRERRLIGATAAGLAALALGASTAGRPASAQDASLSLRQVGSFDQPVFVENAPGARKLLFVVEQPGTVRVLRGGRTLSRPFLDLTDRVRAGGEEGLLSIAFDPRYRKNGRFFVYYTNRKGDIEVDSFKRQRRSATRARRRSRRKVIVVPHPVHSNHNGGQLQFGPDGLLYAGTGDGGGSGDPERTAQDLSSLLGKLLRIDPAAKRGEPYSIPADNPHAEDDDARAEIVAHGLRNPWRFSFDAPTGDLTIGDVGQNAVEEVNHVSRSRGKGANFGWRPYEGNLRLRRDESAPGHVRPVITRSHDAGWCSITGGVVVRDRAVPALYGRYVFGDFCKGRIYSARLAGRRARAVRPTRLSVGSLSSFGQDGRGRVYATSLDGAVYRIAAR